MSTAAPDQPAREADQGASEAALEYARAVHEEHMETNKSLYLRAQIVLTLDGVLLAAVGTALASNPHDVSRVLHRFGAETWALLALAGLALVLAVGCAALALYSRHNAQPAVPPASDDLWFYARIADHKDEFFRRVRGADDRSLETDQRLVQVANIATIMKQRATALNFAFVSTALALFFFAVWAADYLTRLN